MYVWWSDLVFRHYIVPLPLCITNLHHGRFGKNHLKLQLFVSSKKRKSKEIAHMNIDYVRIYNQTYRKCFESLNVTNISVYRFADAEQYCDHTRRKKQNEKEWKPGRQMQRKRGNSERKPPPSGDKNYYTIPIKIVSWYLIEMYAWFVLYFQWKNREKIEHSSLYEMNWFIFINTTNNNNNIDHHRLHAIYKIQKNGRSFVSSLKFQEKKKNIYWISIVLFL